MNQSIRLSQLFHIILHAHLHTHMWQIGLVPQWESSWREECGWKEIWSPTRQEHTISN